MPPETCIQVLLATFNGERFLRDQIDSILGQTYPHVEILASDDGSTDGTLAILNDYAARMPSRVRLISGPPTGSPKANFRRLLKASTAPYLAFADQDDVWSPEKLTLEMQAMRKLEATYGPAKPLLVFSDLEVVDAELRPLAPSLWQLHGLNPRNIHRFERLLMHNIVTGSTTLFNAPLARLAAAMPDDVPVHDWWLALTVCALGHAASLPQKLVRYRQHSANALGAQHSQERRVVPSWRNHENRRAQWKMIVSQAESFRLTYRDTLPPSALSQISALERCDRSTHRLERVWIMLRQRFFLTPLRATLAIAWYLWDRDA